MKQSALHTCMHQLAEIYRWSPIYNGLIYDILILQWYKSDKHSVKTLLQIFNCDVFLGW